MRCIFAGIDIRVKEVFANALLPIDTAVLGIVPGVCIVKHIFLLPSKSMPFCTENTPPFCAVKIVNLGKPVGLTNGNIARCSELGSAIDYRLLLDMKHYLVKHFSVFVLDALNEVSFAAPNKFTRFPLYRTIQFVPMLTPPIAVTVGKLLLYAINGLPILVTVLGN